MDDCAWNLAPARGLSHDINVGNIEICSGAAHVVLQVLPRRIPREIPDIDPAAWLAPAEQVGRSHGERGGQRKGGGVYRSRRLCGEDNMGAADPRSEEGS